MSRTYGDFRQLIFGPLSEIAIDWSSSEKVWRIAGVAYKKYAVRGRRQKSGAPRRILTDFYIGAHALCSDYSLLTLDEKIYQAAFPELRICKNVIRNE